MEFKILHWNTAGVQAECSTRTQQVCRRKCPEEHCRCAGWILHALEHCRCAGGILHSLEHFRRAGGNVQRNIAGVQAESFMHWNTACVQAEFYSDDHNSRSNRKKNNQRSFPMMCTHWKYNVESYSNIHPT